MIIGIGTDLVDIRRIARMLDRHGDRFLSKVFCEGEVNLARCRHGEEFSRTLARRFAAKEAAAKALGSGFRDGVGWRDICVERDELHRPVLVFGGGAAARLARITPSGRTACLHLALSDEFPYAQAMVVIEAL